MSWAAPRTYVTGEVVRARYLNQDLRDSARAAVGSFAYVPTQEGTTSTAYTDLTTVGPSVTVAVVDQLTFFFGAFIFSSAVAGIAIAAFEVSDAAGTLSGPSDEHAAFGEFQTTSRASTMMSGFTNSGMAEGPATVILKYRNATGGSTANFAQRWLLVYGTGPVT